MKLGEVISRWRKMSDIPIRDAAKDIGVSAPTLSRIENGKPSDGRSLARILTWLMQPTEEK
jgi:transcriptional regulator with XRE-family HTH domain